MIYSSLCFSWHIYAACTKLDYLQVVEAFFLDPVTVSYVELEFHPCGAQLAILLHPE